MGNAHFSIGHTAWGSDRISFLGEIFTIEWKPAVGATEEQWASSALADYRQPASYRELTTVETVKIGAKAGACSVDTLIEMLQDLRRMLRLALDYWTADWQTDIVYVAARAEGETNMRYCAVYAGSVAQDVQPYHQILSGLAPELTLVFERGPWLEQPPATSGALSLVECGASESYNGVSFGNVDSSEADDFTSAANEAFIANKQNMANLTHVYVDDGGAFGANLIGAAVPFNLLPAVPAVNDAVYFGINNAVANSGPFLSLVFDIGTAIANVTGTAWEAWNGAAWAAIAGVQDNTDQDGAMTGVAFDTTGVKSVTLALTNTTTVNGIAGFWTRLRVTGIGGGPTAPTQQNRNVYTAVWPYVEIKEAQVGGDVAALGRFQLRVESGNELDYIVCGLRTLARGSDFTAYLNAADEQNPSFVTVAVDGGGSSAFADSYSAPSGRVVRTTTPPAAWQAQYNYTISAAYSSQFYGTFHVYLRAYHTAGSEGDIEFRLRVYELQTTYRTYEGGAPSGHVVDFGRVKILPGALEYAEEGQIYLEVVTYGDGVASVDITDLILIPTDEWAGRFSAYGSWIVDFGYRGTANEDYIDCDSFINPKQMVRSLIKLDSDNSVVTVYRPITNGPIILRNNEAQRLWFLGGTVTTNNPYTLMSVRTLRKQQRYLSMRGGR